MTILPTALADVYVIEPDRHQDDRGGFLRTFCRREFERAGLRADWVQVNRSSNFRAGTLRGLHYQAAPHAEIKLVSCARGAIWDVAVDLRPTSPTFGQWFAQELSAENGRALYIGQGLAHGFQTLTDAAEVMYQMSAFYEPAAAKGIRWNDADLAIDWPTAQTRTISERDQALPTLRDVFETVTSAGVAGMLPSS